jgi:hypothetical protein
VAVIASAIVTAPAAAQQEQLLNQRQSEYNAARIAYESSVASWGVQELNWQAAIDSVNAALRAGNKDRLDRAYYNASVASVELTRLKQVADAAERVLNERRRAFQQILEVRQDDLVVELSKSTTSAAEQNRLAIQVRGLAQEIQGLVAQPAAAMQTQLVFLPNLNLDGRDGRSEIVNKIGLLERWMRQTRFDADPPGARAGRPPDPTQGAPTDAAGRPLTTDQLIEALNAYRDQLILAQDQLRARRANFQGQLASMGGEL